MKFLALILSLIAVSSAFKLPQDFNSSNHWAVLVAGSNGFWNYRHQSDICHAYKILIENGLSAERIIVLAYDDIANNGQNPFKGQIFNKPDPTGKGVDVYAGCKIDYKGKDVTPETFLDVLSGKAINYGTKKTLKSTSNDNVFVYFSDHGATGLIAFPSSELYANDLLNTLKGMSQKKMFNKLVFYLEACESGSMFTDLPTDIKVYATTAANDHESSWATYCSPNDKVNGRSVGSCLGDEYSVNFLEDTEATALKETLDNQFKVIRDKTKGSHVQQYGDKSFVTDELNQYEAQSAETKKVEIDAEYAKYLEEAKKSRVNSRDVKLHYLYQRALFGQGNNFELQQEISHRVKVDTIFSKLNIVQKSDISIDYKCLKESVNNFKSICNEWSDYSLKYVKSIAIACETMSVSTIKSFFEESC